MPKGKGYKTGSTKKAKKVPKQFSQATVKQAQQLKEKKLIKRKKLRITAKRKK